MPAWRQGVAVGEWRQIASSALASAPIAVKTYPTLANTGPSSKVIAWTSLALDTRDSSLYSAANGGHSDYAGNEVDRIRLTDDAPVWTEPRPSTVPAQVVGSTAHYADGRPTSRHSYYGHFVNERRNTVMAVGGARYGDGYGLTSVDGFSLQTNDWLPAGTYPDGFAELGTMGPAIVDQQSTGDLFVFGNWNVTRWNNAANSWSRVLSGTVTYGQYSASAVDTKRNRILVVGGNANDHAVYDITTNTMTSVSLSGPAASSLSGDGNGMIYDPLLDAYLLRKPGSGSTIYRINAQTFAADTLPVSGGSNVPAAQNGVWRRFLYVPALRGVILVPTFTDGIWFLRTN